MEFLPITTGEFAHCSPEYSPHPQVLGELKNFSAHCYPVWTQDKTHSVPVAPPSTPHPAHNPKPLPPRGWALLSFAKLRSLFNSAISAMLGSWPRSPLLVGSSSLALPPPLFSHSPVYLLSHITHEHTCPTITHTIKCMCVHVLYVI